MVSQKPIIFLTGHSGMVGQEICRKFSDTYNVVPLKRDKRDPLHPKWNYQQALNEHKITAPYAVIHLAGAGIADKRWTEKQKKLIIESRTHGTQWLVKTINAQKDQPQAFLCASAIGYYGHRPGETLNENSDSGNNFVAQVAEQWEGAAGQLDQSKTRLIIMRFGMILAQSGGALKNMLTPFKLGLGGRLGKGTQHYSWIGLTDAVRAINFLLNSPVASGVYNLTTEHPVSNATFTKTLAETLHRPAFFHMPKKLVQLIFGQVADELLLADAYVIPDRLRLSGFQFKHGDLKSALADGLQ